MKKRYDVAAYIWPAYTGDEPRARMFWPEGMGEWQSVKNAVKKHPAHTWPRRPLWGYVNEADPWVMEMEIEAALAHGVNVFIYDWYWYDRRPFLENCLNDGFLRARNCEKMKFYLMWANHDAMPLWDIRLSHDAGTVIWQGGVDMAEFKRLAVRLIKRYFHLPNYYRIDGKPVFMIYDVPGFVRGLGGADMARQAIAWLREEAAREGLNGLHLQFAMWSEGLTNVTGVDGGRDLSARDFGEKLGFDSATHYQFVHFTDMNRPYGQILEDVRLEWAKLDRQFAFPYFPHVSVGWDNNPRFRERIDMETRDNTPQNFERALRMARDYLDAHPAQPPLVTLNSWNEWTETSYLQPDGLYGYGYLEAVRRVFAQAE